jgi:hypothetical protein
LDEIREVAKFLELLLQPKDKVREKFTEATGDQLYKMVKLMRNVTSEEHAGTIESLIHERCIEIAELAEAEILGRTDVP